MSDLDLADPYDPDAFGRSSPTPAAHPAPPAAREERAVTPPPPVNREDALPLPTSAAPPAEPDGGPVPWKAAASSVPRLRQQPVSPPPSDPEAAFPGFAQDAMSGHGVGMKGQHAGGVAEGGLGDDPGAAAMPLAAEPPFWEVWLERVRMLPRPIVLGAGAVVLLAVVLVAVLRPRDQASVSLARIIQHPEAYDGQLVEVRGKAGEAFSIGGSYVFNLRQGRDTIVVYSRTRRPSLHERVKAIGTVSVGYLDGAPRVALFEAPPTP